MATAGYKRPHISGISGLSAAYKRLTYSPPPTMELELSLNTCQGPWTPESPGTLHSPTTQVRTRGPGCNGASRVTHIPTTLHDSGIWGQDKREKQVDTQDIKP